MTLNPKKAEVTDRVVGRLNESGIELFLDGKSIGRMKLPEGADIEFAMEPNYESSGSKIYQNYSAPDQKEARYTDCDEGGWC
ncbi:YusG family protein [Falsibacillus pallidus]|uniref:Uncharacterized protein DUF2553 n=1 Tax=Falsibacillus pallidus TaxID=493781 RepID=A0A370GCJ6_9BACI|nr:YusG family protein [Falsibacillus pallidus]RDI41431.1 uncharacterized protein DUF2553 [Falsibacillus pallidus]